MTVFYYYCTFKTSLMISRLFPFLQDEKIEFDFYSFLKINKIKKWNLYYKVKIFIIKIYRLVDYDSNCEKFTSIKLTGSNQEIFLNDNDNLVSLNIQLQIRGWKPICKRKKPILFRLIPLFFLFPTFFEILSGIYRALEKQDIFCWRNFFRKCLSSKTLNLIAICIKLDTVKYASKRFYKVRFYC